MTYLDVVNAVLNRLREDSVATVSATPYSKMIGKFVNDIKRQVEDAWTWDALAVTLTLTLTPGTTTYVLTGSGRRQKNVTVNDGTQKATLRNAPLQWIIDQQQLSTVQPGDPCYYAWNGTNGTDSKVEIYPSPNRASLLYFNMTVPQIDLSSDIDVLLVPADPVIAGAYARALVERGEDGGLASSEAYGIYKGILADYIALEATRSIENECWVAV